MELLENYIWLMISLGVVVFFIFDFFSLSLPSKNKIEESSLQRKLHEEKQRSYLAADEKFEEKRGTLETRLDYYGREHTITFTFDRQRHLKSKLLNFIKAGEIISIQYWGGDSPGKVREVFPIGIDDEYLYAKCIKSRKEKTYRLGRIEICSENEAA